MSFLPATVSPFRCVSGALSVGILSLLFAAPHAWAQGFTTDDTQLRFDGTSVSFGTVFPRFAGDHFLAAGRNAGNDASAQP